MRCTKTIRRAALVPAAALALAGAATTSPTQVAAAPSIAAAPFAPTAPAAPVAPNAHLYPAMMAAGSVIGHPYRWGGSSPGGFDCSGLVMWSFAHAGKSLPHSSAAQRGATMAISREEARAGDLVFYGSPTHHVGIYMGDGLMVHSPRRGDVVKIAPVDRMGAAPNFGRVK
ncbi:MAG: C40 family peptidase [Actinomycetia bacterium]|nr:C40 family peptidase [Actinomycetes bacterium]